MSPNSNSEAPLSNLAADLNELAAERSSEKRVELLRRITDAYLDHADQNTTAEQYLFNEIVSKLVDKIEGADRAVASETLAKMPSLPEAVADRLAFDTDFGVSSPILRGYRALSEKTLVSVARSGTQDHLHAIAGRHEVTPPVSDVVVTRGDQRVVRTLAANSGAQFSVKGMETLVNKAAEDRELQSLIVERSDLTAGAIGKLLPMISSELAKRLRGAAMEFNESVVKGHLKEWAKEREKNIERTDAYIAGIKKGDLRLNDVMLEMIRGKRLLDTATVAAACIDLDRDYAFGVLTGGKPDSVLLLFRSLGVSWVAVDAFLKLRTEKTGLVELGAPPRQRDYDAIDKTAAERVIRFMKVRRAAIAS